MGLYIGNQRVCPIVRLKGDDSKGKYLVTIIDYDGTVLKQDHLNNGDKMYLPPAPNHSNLVFQGWSCADGVSTDSTGAKYVTVDGADLTVGAYYNTTDGRTEIDIELTPNMSLAVTFKMNGTKDWGDGTTSTSTSHTYANPGKYTIKCNGTSWGSTSSTSGLFGQSSSNINYSVTNIRVGSNITTLNATYCFAYLYALRTISLSSKTSTTLGTHWIRNAINLVAIVIPEGFKSLDTYALYNLTNCNYVALPSTLTSLGVSSLMYSQWCSLTVPKALLSLANSSLSNNTKITSFRIPPNLTTLGSTVFNACNALKYLKFPKTLTTIGNTCFASLRDCEYDFTDLTSVPTGGTTMFSALYPNAKIYVPASLVTTWKTATNWATYANYIYGV